MSNIQNALGRVIRAGDPISKTNLKVKTAVCKLVDVLEAEVVGMTLNAGWAKWKIKNGKITDGIFSPKNNTRYAQDFAQIVATTRFLDDINQMVFDATGQYSEVIDKMIAMKKTITDRHIEEYRLGGELEDHDQ